MKPHILRIAIGSTSMPFFVGRATCIAHYRKRPSVPGFDGVAAFKAK